jgi:GT2 family glycosyltransferase
MTTRGPRAGDEPAARAGAELQAALRAMRRDNPATLSGRGAVPAAAGRVVLSLVAEAPRISVVIPTCGRPPLLRRCLQALCAQTLAAGAFEIIVVDDGRSAATRAVVDDLNAALAGSGHRRIACIEPAGTRGPAAARNRGWRAARGALVAFTDDDTVPAPTWLAEGERALRADPQAAAVSGALRVPLHGPPTDHALNTQRMEQAEFVTANCFVRRSALEQVGGFDERFTRAWREDSDLQFTLAAHGLRVIRSPHAVVDHPVRDVAFGHALRSHANLFFDALLYKKHPRAYRERVQRHPPWRYYATVLAFVAMLVAAALGESVAALLAGTAWLGLTLALAWRRSRGTSSRWRDRFEILLTSFAIPFVALYWRLAGAVRWRVLFL